MAAKCSNSAPVLVVAALVMLLALLECADAARWGPYSRGGCRGRGIRSYTAMLMDYKGDAGRACMSTPARPGGRYYARPSRCYNQGGREYGEWYVPDGSCRIEIVSATWGAFEKAPECSAAKPGFRRFVAKLDVDQVDQVAVVDASSLVEVCKAKDATVEGVHFGQPDQCVYKTASSSNVDGAAGDVFGEFYLRDLCCGMAGAGVDAASKCIEEVV